MSAPRLTLRLVFILALLAPGASQSLAQPAASPAAPASPTAPGSMLIIENAGQWPAAAHFQVWNSPLGAGTTWLAEDAIWLVVSRQVDKDQVDKEGRSDCGDPLVSLSTCLPVYSSHALKLTFPGSNPDVRIEPFGAVDTTVSYFLGNDPAQWRPAVPVWSGVRYVDLYPGVDLVLGGSDGAWRFEAAPGVTVERVRVQVDGATSVALDGAALEMNEAGEPLSVALPTASFAYRATGLSGEGDTLALTVRAGSQPARVPRPNDDPSDLLYGTYLGGSGYDTGSGVAIDEAGNVYIVGGTMSSDFPTTPGAFDPTFGGSSDSFVVKLNQGGSGLVYATFLGAGTGSAIAVSADGSSYVTGVGSSDFPTTPGSFDPSHNGGGDTYVAKLNPTGSGLIYSTFLGGSGSDQGEAIVLDAAGAAYVAGLTNSVDFPATPAAFDPSFNGGEWDAFIAKLDPTGSELAYATYVGGSGDDAGFYHAMGVAVDATGSAFLTGSTNSSDFPITPGAFDPTFNGGEWDTFVAKLNPTGTALTYATYLGGSAADFGFGIAVDGMGSAYATGHTSSEDWPTTPGAFDTGLSGSMDGFVVKLNQSGSGLLYATYLGGSRSDPGLAIAVDSGGIAYVAGGTNSSDFPATPDAFDTTYGRNYDAFVAELNPAGSELVYATYLGGSGDENGFGVAMDSHGRAYVVGTTFGGDFPTTPGAFDSTYNGGPDVFVVKLAIQPVEPYEPDVLAPIEQPTSGAFVSGAATLRGFAIDLGSSAGTGIDVVHIYLDGPYGTGTIIGGATYGLDRPDIAAQYGARFGPSGWELACDTAGLASGVHRLYLYAHRTTDNAWSAMEPHLVIVPGGPARWLPIVLRQR